MEIDQIRQKFNLGIVLSAHKTYPAQARATLQLPVLESRLMAAHSTPVAFVAEVSSNHHRDLERCLRFVDVAADLGCAAVKFQLFRVDELFAPEILSQSPQHRDRKDWELPLEFLPALSARCRERNIQFSCTPFYLAAVQQLADHVAFYKVASYELLWDDLLTACARTGKPVVLSTGMSTVDEIDHAIEVLRDAGCREPTLLHCVSAYPVPPHDCNLAAIATLRERHHCKVGWSDHSVRPSVIARAIHKWQAQFVEFHLDLDGHGAEFASGHCWTPEQIRPVIEMTQEAFSADGTGDKAPTASEASDRDWRADPSDGLRPLRHLRKTWRPT